MSDSDQNRHIMERLNQWGCDVRSAMPRFLNNTDMYCQLLRSVPKQDSFDKLGAALDEGNPEEAFEQAHSLKGVLANMAITPMYAEVCEIVERLRGGDMDGVPARYEELLREKAILQDILSEKGESDS